MAAQEKVKYCRFLNCNNNSLINSNLKYFKFTPKNASEWKIACKDEKISKLSNHTLCRYNHYVCSDHFKNDDYRMILKPFDTMLKVGAIPGDNFQQSQGKFISSLIFFFCMVA